MPFEMTCGHCGSTLYWGLDIKSPRDVIREDGFRCRNCGVKLSFESHIEIIEASNPMLPVTAVAIASRESGKLQAEPAEYLS